ncbi:MAG: DUF1565 domain-containing protein [Nostocales cyanobacterium 94392]|nr:DUF1565 domain-containing protein [Nostocales cyanobacterium 94392]
MRTSSISSVVFVTISFTALTTALLNINPNVAIAQISSISKGKILSENSISQVNVLFVNPSIGNDTSTNGSESAPLKTITQALQIAKNNTIIRLAKGTYSAQEGETFPLIIKSGIVIEGDIRTQGKDIIIQGGGEYLSRFYGSKNVAIVATDNANITGVTVTNSNVRGYGIWIESNQPVVEANTFTGSTQDGIAVTGTAIPQIKNNYFYSNGANGITISGTSQAQIEQNTFQDTGFGINIAQDASPQIIGNKISHNRTGVVIQASSSPVLRNNSIFNNKEDGLVVIAKATPDLGHSSSPGGNQFNFNGRYDINAQAATQQVSAYGNNLASNRIAGKVDVTAAAAPIKAPLSSTPTPTPRLLKPLLPRENTPTPSTDDEQQFNHVQVQPDTIEFTAPQADTPSSLPLLEPAPRGESALLPVPPTRIPVNNNGNTTMPAPRVPQNTRKIQATTTQTALRYRVIVEAVTPRQQELVKFIVSDAFRTSRGGKQVMQAGIFSDRNKANNLVRQFKNNGLKAEIIRE